MKFLTCIPHGVLEKEVIHVALNSCVYTKQNIEKTFQGEK